MFDFFALKPQNISFILELQCESLKYAYFLVLLLLLIHCYHRGIIWLSIEHLLFVLQNVPYNICLYYQNKDKQLMKWITQILLYLLHICPIPIFPEDGLHVAI